MRLCVCVCVCEWLPMPQNGHNEKKDQFLSGVTGLNSLFFS